jgi:cysteine desulfurase/selenocysteine lyase
MCAPTGIGALWGRAELLAAMPPWHGGGEMIVSVALERSTFKAPPQRFEAGTPNIAGAIGLGAAVDYLTRIGPESILKHSQSLARRAVERLSELPGVRILGSPAQGGGVVSFVMESAHPHDLTTFADRYGVALRGGHHCTQPLMKKFGLPGTTRASFYLYNTAAEVDRLAEVIAMAHRFFA